MKPRFSVLMLCLLAAAVFSLASQSNTQRTPRGQVHALQATSDSDGSRTRNFRLCGMLAALAASEITNGPQPSCYVTGPGFTGILNKGKTANLTGAGTVTLKCSGQGYMRCDARVDIPPPSK